MEPFVIVTLLVIFAYAVASFSSAIIVCQLMGLPDPRTEGSQNPGATNVLRIAGKKEAGIVLLVDMAKGLVFVLLAKLYHFEAFQTSLIGLAAIIGHMFPIYYRFGGGKGVATSLGVYLGLDFMFGVSLIGVWLLVLRLFSYSSLSSIVVVILAPFLSVVFLHSPAAFLPLLIASVLILIKHQQNINRLMEGQESKTSFGKKSEPKESAK